MDFQRVNVLYVTNIQIKKQNIITILEASPGLLPVITCSPASDHSDLELIDQFCWLLNFICVYLESVSGSEIVQSWGI